MHAHAHAIVLTYAHALDLTRADAITRTCAADADLIRTLDLTRARALADAIASDLAGAIDLAHVRAVELADAIDLDLSVLGAFDFDVDHTRELARVHVTDLDRAYALARSIPDLRCRLASLGLASVHTLDPALPLPGVLGLPLRWVADGPLASTLLQVLAANSPSGAGGPLAGQRPVPGIRARALVPSRDSRDHAAQGGPRPPTHRRAAWVDGSQSRTAWLSRLEPGNGAHAA